jgi:phosphate starvation-inducible PhoH-like protein
MNEAPGVFEPISLSAKAVRRRERKAAKRTENSAASALVPRSENQGKLLHALARHPVVFAIGPAGTGKTYVPARFAMRKLMTAGSGIDSIIISRPTSSPKRHQLGFLPGNAAAKMKPWLVPIMDGFRDENSQAQTDKMMAEGKIEVVPFEHMRGRSFHNAVVLLDEAQNCSLSDLELLMTRTGEDSLVVVSGDHGQVDIEDTGLLRCARMIEKHGLDAALIEFDWRDVVRSKVAAEWVKAFAKEHGTFVEHH